MEEKENFESALRSLEQAVERLESGELSLEESLECFEAGVKVASRCQQFLRRVEARVQLLLKDREGNLTLEDFEKE
jgi:exodeoxyribonuclease VII small subunit